MKRLILYLIMATILLASVSADVHYVNQTTGNDANAGTSAASPWRTVAKACNSTSAGDTVMFNRGVLWRERCTVSQANSNWTNYGEGPLPIFSAASVNATNCSLWNNTGNIYTFNGTLLNRAATMWYNVSTGLSVGAYKKGNSALLTNTYDYYYNTTTNRMQVYSSIGSPCNSWNGVEIPDINATVVAWGDSFWGVNATGVIFDGLEFDYQNSNMDAAQLYARAADNLRVLNSVFKYSWEAGIYLDATPKPNITDNYFFRTGRKGQSSGSGGGNSQGENIFMDKSNDAFIFHNTLNKTGNVGINCFSSLRARIINNTVVDYENYNSSQGGFAAYADACNNTVFSGNFLKNIGGGISVNAEGPGGDTTWFNNITDNIIINYQHAGINTDSNLAQKNVHNTTILRNTLFRDTYVSYWDMRLLYSNGTFMRNNIVQNNYTTNNGALVYTDNSVNLNSDYNLFNSTIGRAFSVNTSDKTWVQWQALGYDANGKQDYTVFISHVLGDYRPIAGSAACNASTTGSYVGALPCASGQTVTLIKYYLFKAPITKIYGNVVLRLTG